MFYMYTSKLWRNRFVEEYIIKEYYEKNPEGLPGIPTIPEIYEGHQLFIERVLKERPKTFLDAGCGKGYS